MIKRGLARTPHRALLKALGVENHDFDKPFIAVANSSSSIVPGHAHLDKIADAVNAGIFAAGGVLNLKVVIWQMIHFWGQI